MRTIRFSPFLIKKNVFVLVLYLLVPYIYLRYIEQMFASLRQIPDVSLS